MAESTDKAAESAEKAYAAAAAEAKLGASEAAKAEPVKAPAAAKVEPASADKPVAAKAAPKKAAAKKKKVRKPAAKARPAAGKKSPPRRKPAAKAARSAGRPQPTVTQLKEKIMATAKTPDFTKPFADAVSEMQSKTKEAYDKGTAYAGEMTEFAKGNVEAFVESGKVLSAGVQDIGKTYAEDAKSAYETFTADVKEMAAVKSPTELLQLQGKLARRNFDSMVAFSSKTGDAMLKLYTDAFAPISGRVSAAAEKLSKAA